MLLQNYVPPLEGLPRLIMRLSADVFWDDEKDCFDSFCREVARWVGINNFCFRVRPARLLRH